MREKKKLLAVLGTVFVCLLCVWGLLLFTKDSAKNGTGNKAEAAGDVDSTGAAAGQNRMRWNGLRFGMRRGIM